MVTVTSFEKLINFVSMSYLWTSVDRGLYKLKEKESMQADSYCEDLWPKESKSLCSSFSSDLGKVDLEPSAGNTEAKQ